jgi:Fic family protein
VTALAPLQRLPTARFETPAILKKLAGASRHLAELKGVAASIPNQAILVNALGMQEAKDSSAIENIVTTHDELYRDEASPETSTNPAAKEVLRYREALWHGYRAVRERRLLTSNHILRIQAVLEHERVGFRKLPGTALKDGAGRTVYTPPSPELLPGLMGDLERFINDPLIFEADPLIRMALIHYQFESIHPFYDGNGRTGRIINVLYLVKEGLLDIPILYLSHAIVRTKADYYRLLQGVRDQDAWEDWVLYILDSVEATAREGVNTVNKIGAALLDVKHRLRAEHPRIYSQALINNLFQHPYTKIEFIERDLQVSRLTASKYLDTLNASGFLLKKKIGRSNYYINEALTAILAV